MTRHVILAYGRETEYKRAIFAVLSFWARYAGNKADVRTVVFTDQPDAFAVYLDGLPVEYVLLTAAALEEMYGPQRYIHRVKAVIIEQVFQNYPNDNVLFCDSDTFFIAESDKLLQGLHPGVSFMHLREHRFCDAIPPWATSSQAIKLQAAIDMIDNHTFQVGSEKLKFSKTQFMWNSGVLGLTKEIASLMPSICALIDALYADSEWLVSEQVAFALVLPSKTQLLPSKDYVFHYWNQPLKVLMDSLLSEILSKRFSELGLVARLSEVKRLTDKWPRTIIVANARESALRAFSSGEMIAGIRASTKVILASLSTRYFLKFYSAF